MKFLKYLLNRWKMRYLNSNLSSINGCDRNPVYFGQKIEKVQRVLPLPHPPSPQGSLAWYNEVLDTRL